MPELNSAPVDASISGTEKLLTTDFETLTPDQVAGRTAQVPLSKVLLVEGAAPATPAAGHVIVYSKADGLVYSKDDAGVESPLGAGVTANRFVNVALSDMTTDITTGTAKAVWFAPEDGDLASVYIGLHDPSSSGAVTVDMNDSGGSVFTTLPSIDATEATSITGTAAVLDGTVSFVRGDKFTFDIDAAGTDAKGLQICIEYAPT